MHLISSFKYPLLPSINLDQVVEYLLHAPKIVKELAPMSWQYMHAPQDGTVLLAWQASGAMEGRFASDGYVWADPEATFAQSIRGYTLECLVHRSGYRPGYEQVATHARHRYRLARKDPNTNVPPPDPSLWLIHYCQADPQNRLPVNRISTPPEVQKSMQERRYLESQGQPLRKEFMLHDRNNWPTISMPSGGVQGSYLQQQSVYQQTALAQMGGHRGPQSYYPQGASAAIGPSPAKRPRQVPPTQYTGAGMPGAGASAVPGMLQDSTIEDEENTTVGDLLDNLTPRDISTMRYIQHHEWMEEIFSSPYAVGQIIPIDLGFGLTGELAQLTEGLFDTPSVELDALSGETAKDTATSKGTLKSHRRMEAVKFEEFHNRVLKYVEKEETEIERMKQEHASKMAELRKGDIYMRAERRLRDAMWDANERGTESWRVDINGEPSHDEFRSASHEATETVDDVVREVEESLAIKVEPQKVVICVEKGGLQGEDTNLRITGVESHAANGAFHNGNVEQFGHVSFQSTPNPPTLVTQQSASHAPGDLGTLGQSTDEQTASHLDQTTTDTNGLSLLDGMDFRLDAQHTPTAGAPAPDTGDASDWVMVDQNSDEGAQSTIEQATAIGVEGPQDPSADLQPDPTSAMFDTADFGGFENLDSAGDALMDYGGVGDDLGLDLDNSAFGDAFHGTESHQEHDEAGPT
ncbi:hypothetical protein BJ546DRAFT_946096 [Cryomyces antarcticus]